MCIRDRSKPPRVFIHWCQPRYLPLVLAYCWGGCSHCWFMLVWRQPWCLMPCRYPLICMGCVFCRHIRLPDVYKRQLWGLLTVLALALGLRTCIDHSLFKKRNRMLVMLAACLLMLAVTLPYRPLDLPLLSLIHILLSFAAPLSLLAAVFMIFMDLRMLYPSLMAPYLSVFLLICVIALGIYFKYASVNTLVEICLLYTSQWL